VRTLPLDATDQDLLAACREWLALVSDERYEEAIAFLYVPTDYDPSQRWTPSTLRQYISNYGSWDPWPDGRTWRITSLESASLPADAQTWRPRADVVRFDKHPLAGSIEVDVPLNGVWSDLTAQFEFKVLHGQLVLSLYDLHVL
jgi:hypothetical protein